MNTNNRPTYLHSVYRADRSVRRLYIEDFIIEITIGGMSRRAARRRAAREIHAENCYQARLRAAQASGSSQFTAECLAAQ